MLGSYSDLSPGFYQTYQHESWQHPGSSEWSRAPVPGWGNNPNLQMFERRGVGAVDVTSPPVLFPLGGAVAGYFLAKRSRGLMAVGGAVVGWALSQFVKPGEPEGPPPAAPSPPSTEGLGWWGPWAKSWYTIWNGARWLPARYTSAGSATDWLLDQKESNWNKAVKMYRHTGSGWVPAA